MTVLALGAPIGAWLGANMAGAVAHAYTWRAAFLALGVPGLVVGIIVYLTVREPPRGRLDAIVDDIKPSLLRVAAISCGSRRRPSTWSWAAALCALWGWGLMYWTPAFLQRAYNLDVGQAGAVTGNIHLVGGSLATVGTAWLLSRPSMADPRRVVWLLAAGIGARDHSFDHRLLDSFTVAVQADVLAFSSRPSISTSVRVSGCSTISRPATCAICSSPYRCWWPICSI